MIISLFVKKIVPGHIADIKGRVEVTRWPFVPFANLQACNMAGFHLHVKGKGVRRTWQLWSSPTCLSNASEGLEFGKDTSRKTHKGSQSGISFCTGHTSLGDVGAEERNVPHQGWKSAVCIFQSS